MKNIILPALLLSALPTTLLHADVALPTPAPSIAPAIADEHETEVIKALENFRKRLQELFEEAEDPAQKTTPSGFQSPLPANIMVQLKAGGYAGVLSNLQSISSGYPFASIEYRALKSAIESYQRDKELKKAAELDASFKKLAAELLAATKAEELDSWIKTLKDLAGGASSYQLRTGTTEELRLMQSYLNSALPVVTSWQDYLMGIELRNRDSSQRALSNLSGQITQFPYVPRSKVLFLTATLNNPNLNLEDNNFLPVTLEDFEKRLTSLDAAMKVRSELSGISSSERVRRGLDPLYRNLDKINNAASYLAKGSYSSGFSNLRELQRDQLLRPIVLPLLEDALRLSMKIPKEFKSIDGERAEAFIERYLRSISTDTQKLWSAMKAGREYFASGNARSMMDSEIKSVEYILSAQSYEKQKLYARAIVAYRQAIGSITEYTPKDFAGKAMARLNKEHPEAAAAAELMSSHTTSSYRLSRSTPRLNSSELRFVAKEVERLLQEREKEDNKTPEKPSPEKQKRPDPQARP